MSLPEESRTLSAGTSILYCPDHTGLTVAQHFAALAIDEIPRKNFIQNKILTQFPALTEADIVFAFTPKPSRVLNITINKLTAAQKVTLQSVADTRFGAGKVLFL